MRLHRNRLWMWPALFGMLSVALIVVSPDPVHAGLLDFLFGTAQPQPPAPPVSSYAEPAAPAPPFAAGPEGVREGNGGGRYVAFCVRLCDGQHFPLEHMAYATPIETCRAMCPASKTKVFFGNGIDHAAARDGQRYADLDNAFVYRNHLVAGCTCNGKDAFGLAPFDATSDPTLRPGDIVATKDGFVAYTGKRGQIAFTPVDASTLTAALNQASSFAHARLTRLAEPQPVAEEEPGIIVRPQADVAADFRPQAAR
ncbi:MAG TPA: DUF2865 domain-containing protein [Xanthobacteraceae bacterium]|nr:DUF2865 domain-containing protein [Xanthobacteraceae bacterium]